MKHSSLNKNKGVSLKQRAKIFGIDVDTIIQDLKDRISPHEDQEEYFSYSMRISNDFISGITEYAKKYGLCRVVIGRIDTDGPGELLVCISRDGSIQWDCPTCMESKTVSLDSSFSYLDKPNYIVNSLIRAIIETSERKRKSSEMYCSNLEEL
jgi:hypothetical protein